MTVEQKPLLIVWNDSYHTGINICDEQHRGIVSIINSLHFSQSLPSSAAFLRPIAEMIMGYTKIHFSIEIELLEKSEYPRLREHQQQHDHLITEVNRILAACLHDGEDPNQFLTFLKEWLLVHIAHEDKAYGAHLTEYLKNQHRGL
jgi:hemerythrin-like metal-binding protein